MISADDALEILRIAYSVMEPKEDGKCNEYKEMESVFLFLYLKEWKLEMTILHLLFVKIEI